MFTREKPPLSELIILELSKRPGSSAQQLVDRLIYKRDCTFQAVYKELKLLLLKGVVLKVDGEFSLNQVWLDQLFEFVHNTHDNYKNQIETLILRKSGESKKWFFSNLFLMDDFWGHLLASLIKNVESETLYEWAPHPWFELINTEKEKSYHKVLEHEKIKLYMIVSGNSYLDHICKKAWPKSVFTSSFGSKLKLFPNNTYVNVIDDYIVTLKLPKKFSEKLHAYYRRVKMKSDYDAKEIFSIFQERVKASIKIENNPSKANKIKNQFIDYFDKRS